MSADTGVFVLSTTHKVHELWCRTLGDYTDGRRVRDFGHGGWEEQGSVRSEDRRVTRTAVESGAHGRYRRCRVCAPKVDEWVERPIERPRSAASVCGNDIGRVTASGTLLGVVADPHRVSLTFSEAGSVDFRPDETVVFFQPRPGAA